MTDRHELEQVKEQAVRVYVKTTLAALALTAALWIL